MPPLPHLSETLACMYVCISATVLLQTCRLDGTVQVWSVEDGSLVSSCSLEQEVCTQHDYLAALGY